MTRDAHSGAISVDRISQVEIIQPGHAANDRASDIFELEKRAYADITNLDGRTLHALELLRSFGLKLVVSSSSAQHFVDEFATRQRFRFDLVLGFDANLAKGRPHVSRTCAAFGVATGEIVFCGDSPPRRNDHHHDREQHGDGQRLDVHAASLTADLGELGGVLDRLRPGIHVALTARCKRDSRLLSGLKHAQRAGPERQERRQAPQAMYVDRDQQHGDANAGGDQDHAEPRASSTLANPDVRDASRRGVSFGHGSLPHVRAGACSRRTGRARRCMASCIYIDIFLFTDMVKPGQRRAPWRRKTAGRPIPAASPVTARQRATSIASRRILATGRACGRRRSRGMRARDR